MSVAQTEREGSQLLEKVTAAYAVESVKERFRSNGSGILVFMGRRSRKMKCFRSL